MRHMRTAAVGIAASVICGALAAPTDGATVGTAPVGKVEIGKLPSGIALADDGTTYYVQYVDAAQGANLHVRAPNGAENVITGVGQIDVDVHPTEGVATTDRYEDLVVVDPAQAAGPVVPVRTIDGPATLIDDVVSVAWAEDGSLWVSDLDADGVVDLLRFAPGADGNIAPVQVISGNRTELIASDGFYIDDLPGGAVVAAAIGTDADILVFDASAVGNVAPTRRITAPLSGPSIAQFGVAADHYGRIHVAVGDIGTADWGHVYVYAPGAGREAEPILDLTGATSELHIPVYPAIAPNGDLAVTDAVFVNNQIGEVRLLTFDALPAPPSAPRSLKVARRPTGVRFTWRSPVDDGGAPLAGYRVQITRGDRVVLTKVVTDGRRLRVRRGRLPSGRLTARVSAVNAAGRGAAAARVFRLPGRSAR